MKKFKLTREVRVGILTVVSVFVLYFGLNFLKGVNVFSPINTYYATYDNIDGLVPSSPVYVKGFKVGQVEEVKYDFSKEQSFVVKITVSRDIKLPKTARIELFDDGLMGGKAIQLIYPTYKISDTFYASGDTLPSTVGSGLLDQIAGDLMPKIETIANQADSLLMSVRKMIDGEAVQNSLASIEHTTAELAVTSTALKRMVNKDLPVIMSDVQVLTGDFRVISANLRQIDFASTFDKMDVTITSLNQITRKINSSEGSIGLLLNDKELYQNLTNTANSTDLLLIDMKQNPKRYVHFSLFGRKKD